MAFLSALIAGFPAWVFPKARQHGVESSLIKEVGFLLRFWSEQVRLHAFARAS